ncbi:MAG: YbaB/EbfC family nucleoid-associated protein [Candidatus Marinimicrobia bacterium]|nr:YbaB/EbfC family nucleoid-associated protein [Candidatus Neomarinimicrobiota bacterium]MBI71891.1 YbaB/EbfC family nucleoid-associated protein [Candidatus Neomarinimicrobiota bacterium]|tara:strand:+ start:79 stop:396 length:318 start_codon:yes stop_codon:yes gene_type:complete
MFPKGGMGGMMKQAQQMQKKMAQIQSEIEQLKIEGKSGGGMVEVVVDGKKNLLSISLNPEILKEDKEMLEDLIVVAVNDGIKKVDSISKEKMASVTGGMNLPGLF